MDEKDLAKNLRAVADAPADPDPWLALARDLDRAEQPTPELEDALLEPFLAAWRAAPEARELERFFQVLTLLIPTRYEVAPPAWLREPWVEAEDASRVPYHRDLGLPMACRRLEGDTALWLHPGGELLVDHPQAGRERFRVRWGYVPASLAQFVREGIEDDEPALDYAGLDQFLRASGELLPEIPPPAAAPMPFSRLLGRRVAHGLTPEDRQPLPPPPVPSPLAGEPVLRPPGAPPPPMRLGGAPAVPTIPPMPPPRLSGAPPQPALPTRLVQWFKDLFEK